MKWIESNEFRPGDDNPILNVGYLVKGEAFIKLKEEYKGSSDHTPHLKVSFYTMIDRHSIREHNHSLDNSLIHNVKFYCCQQKVQDMEGINAGLHLELKDAILQARFKDEYHRLYMKETELHAEKLRTFVLMAEKIKEFCDPEDYRFYRYDYWIALKK